MTVHRQTAGNNPNPNIRHNPNNRPQPPRMGLNRQAPVRGDQHNEPHPQEPQQINSKPINPVVGGGRKSRKHRKSHKKSKKTHIKH